MKTIRKSIRREDIGDAMLFMAVTALLLSGLEFMFTAMSLHYISTPIIAVEAAAAVAAGALVSLVVIAATEDED